MGSIPMSCCGLMQKEDIRQLAAAKSSTITVLWFDVERGYKTTKSKKSTSGLLLWFDVERGYKTTHLLRPVERGGCGLMQEENIRQHADGNQYVLKVVV